MRWRLACRLRTGSDQPLPKSLQDVYETNLGSFVTQVDVWVANGPPIVVFNGPDTTACPGILSIPFSTDLPVVGVTVQTAKVGWEEIDAVAVIN